MTITQRDPTPPRGIFYRNRRPMMFFVSGGGEAIHCILESNGARITRSLSAAQIIVFNRDNCSTISWPTSAEEIDILERVREIGGHQPVVASTWVCECSREGRLVDRSKYFILLNSHDIVAPSSPSSRIAQSVTPLNASSLRSTGSAPAQPSPLLHLNQGNQTIVLPQAARHKLQSITPGRRTDNNWASSIPRGDHNLPFPYAQSTSDAQVTYTASSSAIQEITKEQAQSIIVTELYQFAHKRSSVTESDLKLFLKELEGRRKERAWRLFYRRENEVIDQLLRNQGLDPTGWHSFSGKKRKVHDSNIDNDGDYEKDDGVGTIRRGPGAYTTKKKASRMKGWAWVTEGDES
ncbi:hypothetical protein I302_108531 [Kwoniella bestiolae CBS 10118]|uniref:BRCT domain-containing protein n=1 Tax=Kwoniella bestiolae CBS 10118 TaxID=1296100 RepID=A0A1B9FVG3_9TREE|nr:hypothetical protein I302_07096 [Kwoniella bestiolae CBS 10118]OCF22755.1 hypothetical protein I302_07096 [Kwoniella bestiolae CBS 10118]